MGPRKPLPGRIPAGAIRPVVLALLAEEPAHGYALCKRVSARTGGKLKLSEGSLYPILHTLELEGLVTVRTTTAPSGRERRVYHLTRPGRREATDERAQWLETAGALVALLSPVDA